MKDLLNARQCVFNRERDTPISMAMETLAIHYASGFRCNLVFKDVSKVLNKLWHLGLKFKIFYCKLPEPVEPLLCDFLDDCKLKVRMGNHQAPPPFPLHTGMLQGSILAPINSFERTCRIITHDLVHCNPFGHPPPRFPCNGIQTFREGLCLPHYSEGYQGVVKP